MKAVLPLTINLDGYELQVVYNSLTNHLETGGRNPILDLLLYDIQQKAAPLFFNIRSGKLKVDLKECFALREYAGKVPAVGEELAVWRKLYNETDRHIINNWRGAITPLLTA